MTKIITYKCDQCGWEKIISFIPGSQFPRVLWIIGKMEVCDQCMDRLRKVIEKDKQELLASSFV